ncbi:MAG: hypothetical protein J2P40_12540 [Candidatus Dormibacteraeota bacterium]|nr:hypothetical protein [Candidatus Dormibacteraeota bacterium]MBO0704056.1 hypothetical protein [Candidatus Dormibacteraeota bacterium]MBO0762094.1 hypothetical protein [Candidatus Dormibacteraeota bacterium]
MSEDRRTAAFEKVVADVERRGSTLDAQARELARHFYAAGFDDGYSVGQQVGDERRAQRIRQALGLDG